MNDLKLQELMTHFSSEKNYFSGGYYRIRNLSEREVELAFLIPDGCGTTTVHPQITLEKIANHWQPIKLLDMATSPTQFIELSEETKDFLTQQLELLIEKFEVAQTHF